MISHLKIESPGWRARGFSEIVSFFDASRLIKTQKTSPGKFYSVACEQVAAISTELGA
jgi:hypothetical protein